jgi:hypothetical protein
MIFKYFLGNIQAFIFVCGKDFKFVNEYFLHGLLFITGGLTVCVTRAGSGGGTPSDWENAEA